MKTLSPSRRSRASLKSGAGVSLIEIVLVISLLSVIGGMTLFISLDSYRGHLFHSDQELLVTALHRARSQAVGNVCLGAGCTNGKPHGVAIRPADNPNSYVIFQTSATAPSDYAHRDTAQDILIPVNEATVFTGPLSEVVFSPLSGSATPGTISVASFNRTSVFTIGSQGQIRWTN